MPKVEFTFWWSPIEMAHAFMGVAHYQALLTDSGDGIIPDHHPIAQVQAAVVEKLIPLIASGVANGWDVEPLIQVQNMLNSAMEQGRQANDESIE